ncbi:VWA-like domain-containing protein [Paraclostridium benzoelyticum]|uniref:vWA domain-containing protein n=1 Tax=Paraclostridium benzoelyticum TaxID=1629550 RepID=UPI0031CD0C49
MISALKNSNGELPWNLYLKKLMGTVESNKKKTITRRNRRQPNRLDLRGELRGHKAEIAVALDISGSISDEEFKQAIKEVLNIVKNYNQEITIIECDNEIKRTYKVKSYKDIKDRLKIRGGTRFSPVFNYSNNKKINLLVYFTDGKGEDRLQVIPKGYKILWVISGRGDKLSLKKPYGAVKKLSKVKVKETTIDMSDVRDDGYSMNNQAPIL